MRARRRHALIALAALAVAGCASFPAFEPLRVTVAGVEPLDSEGLEWRMLVRLRVQNPNDVAIAYDGVSVGLDVLDVGLASGVSDAAGSIPRFGESVIAVPVTVSMVNLVSRALRMTDAAPPRAITYRLQGKLHGPGFGSTGFESRGELVLPGTGAG